MEQRETRAAAAAAIRRSSRDQLVRAFLTYLRQRRYSPATVSRRRTDMKRFLRFLTARHVFRFQDVDVATLDAYRLELVEQGCALNTIHAYLRGVRVLFRFLETRGELFENPTLELVVGRNDPRLPDVLSEDEVKRLMAAPDCSTLSGLRDRTMLEVLYSTGIRREELISMTVFSVDFDNRTVRVLGKGRKERLVPIGVTACRYLREYIRNVRPGFLDSSHPHSDRLWWNFQKRPQSLQMPPRMVRMHAARAGITRPVTTHTLRRSCATHMLAHGAHPVMVAEMLGHAELSILSHYLRVTITDLMKMHRGSKLGK